MGEENIIANEGNFSLSEAQRQIAALWKKNNLLEDDMRANAKDIQTVALQMPYVVALLEKIDKAQAAQAPNCAVRGVRIDSLEQDVSKLTDICERSVGRIEKLENTNSILKWMTGIIATIFSGVAIAKVAEVLSK